jgi:hypothetical protein
VVFGYALAHVRASGLTVGPALPVPPSVTICRHHHHQPVVFVLAPFLRNYAPMTADGRFLLAYRSARPSAQSTPSSRRKATRSEFARPVDDGTYPEWVSLRRVTFAYALAVFIWLDGCLILRALFPSARSCRSPASAAACRW